MTGQPLVDREARQRIRQDLEATLVVEAAAGTGKTSELVARIVAVLRSGRTSLARLVAVTFTEKAAGEMKLRVRSEVERARSDPATPAAERRRLDQALRELEVARIATIHSLCADLLRERPVEARVDPAFEVASEDESRRLYEQAFDRWFQAALAEPPEGVRRMLRRRPRGRDAQGPRQALEDAGWRLVGRRDFQAPWRRDPFDRDGAIDRMVEEVLAFGALGERAGNPGDFLTQAVARVERTAREIRHREAVRPRDHDALEAGLRDLSHERAWGWKGYARDWEGITREEVLARKEALKARLDGLRSAADADLAATLHGELLPLVAAYEELKARAGKLDFLDLLLRARGLVRDNREVRRDLASRFTHIFVDEFQDTDPLQAEILVLLGADDPGERDWTRAHPVPGKLFLVGDPKQSIYRFRRADIALYQTAKRVLEARGAEVLYLRTSFRGAPSLQEAVNQAFAPLMPGPEGSSLQADYVPLEAYRTDLEGQPALVALPVPRPYGERSVTRWAVEESFPDAVGAFVDWLVTRSGWKVREGERLVLLEARHVCVLLKRFQAYGRDVTRGYTAALEARRIPHVLVGGRAFHDREEVVALRAALAAVEWPSDELNVYATLRGPLFALGDDLLLAWRHRFGSLNPLRPRADGASFTGDEVPLAQVAQALDVLRGLHRGRNRHPIASSIARLLEATRAHAGVAIWPTGEQALANLLRTMDLARRHEAAGATSFRSFLDRLEGDAERGEAHEAPVVEEGTEGVRIMTVHRAKGLEFPVVILADPTAPFTHENPSRWIDPERGLWVEPLAGAVPAELEEHREEALRRDAEEAVRVAYVAATRARDLLVVPAIGDEELDGWLAVLNPVLYPPPQTRRRPGMAPGCPDFGPESVVERRGRQAALAGSSVAPGLHAPRAGSHRVVWWDPGVLDLGRRHDVGLRQERILAADEGEVLAGAGVEAHRRWQARRAEVGTRGARVSLRVVAATGLALEVGTREPGADGRGGAPAAGARVAVERVSRRRRERPHGKRFGTLVHGLLASVPLEAGRAAIEALAVVQGRVVGADAAEREAAVEAVAAALEHPLLERARAAQRSGGCRREAPVVLPLADGTLVEGVVDLAFREVLQGAGLWTVVDFKTDLELGAHQPAYEAQVALYVQAVQAATGEAATGLLLSV